MSIHFYVRFSTQPGESLHITLINGSGLQESKAMQYLSEELWHLEIDTEFPVQYRYSLQGKDGIMISEWESERRLDKPYHEVQDIVVIDTWNHAGSFENVFYTAPFNKVLFKEKHTKTSVPAAKLKNASHVFKVKAPLLEKNEVACLTGNGESLGNWSTDSPILLKRDGHWWTVTLHIDKKDFPLAYKYGVYNTKEKEFVRYEEGDNRLLHGESSKKRLTVIHDGFVRLPADTWKGAGIAIPVFSLRTKNSFGVGEFNDLRLLVDWAKKTGLKMIQILPVNDTTATHSWLDSYPYAAISAFALHPIYINLEKTAGKKHADKLKPLRKKQKSLNDLTEIDYEQVMKFKWGALRELFEASRKELEDDEDFKKFFQHNKGWLVPYAAFSFLRDKYGSSKFEDWKSHSIYNAEEIKKITSARSRHYNEILFFYFIQYHLHQQLKEAADYAHSKGVVIKGDIPIGIYRNGCDAWVAPELYNMDMQSGAPPDDFAIKGQNWGFPTYNWQKMQEDGFAWWRQRFEQMSHYFDAFRIDHILGFFRIWSIPIHAVEGIMGHFIPAVPVSIHEFGEKGIWFDYERYCKPYIDFDILREIFGESADYIASTFLTQNSRGGYDLLPDFNTQVKVQEHFRHLEDTEHNHKLKQGLFDLISNVLLFEEEGSGAEKFHFRFAMENTPGFSRLDWHLQQKLKDLYVDYFFRRQDAFWFQEAMKKLPVLKSATNMMVCGEDLGMVPHSVPEVMQQLGILSLEIQRMPKDLHREFFHPNDAPYLSVVTPSTHDMSTIRGWWEENPERTQHFFNHVMGQWGSAPFYCEAWINRAIVMQHLYSPAMWSIFQLQDLLGMSESLRRENPHEERINIPADPKHYWRYRMHISLENLLKQDEFNKELQEYVKNSGR